MINKILFSPIGGSDPVNALYDGAWIHCCRHFQPDLTVIYLSAQMLPRENDKHFFSGTLNKLNQFLGKEILFEKEERPDLKNPQDFEAFYDDFEEVLSRYHRQYPDAEILVNVSSGTPAMKGCLIHLYHMLSFPVKIIQVFGPHDEMGLDKGKRYTVSDDYSVDDGWDTDLDNEEGAENRCHILKDQQQAVRLKIMQLKALISRQEYSAARTLAEDPDLKSSLPEELHKTLQAAVSRIQMDLIKAGNLFIGFDYDDGKMIRANAGRSLFQGAEMLHTMVLDYERDDIAGCLRKLTPVLFTLIVGNIGKYGMDILSVTTEDENYLSKSKMAEKYPEQLSTFEQDAFKNPKYPNTALMDSDTLLKIMNKLSGNSTPVSDNIRALRKTEMNIRNAVAHKPVKMTEDVFRSKAGCGVEDMLARLKETFNLLEPELFGNSYWGSYERMKDFILSILISD